jgi:dihydrofolate reductase
MKTQYYTASSLDGFIATEDHSLAWLLQFGEPADSGYPEFVRDVGALAMGASTYEWLLRHHVKPGAPDGAPWPYAQPTWVFTHRALPRIEGAPLRFVKGNVAPVHRDMAEAAGERNIWIVGGGELAGQFHDAGLLDEVIVQVAAVTLGRGAPLLPRRIASPPLRLLSARPFAGAFVELRYAVPRQDTP